MSQPRVSCLNFVNDLISVAYAFGCKPGSKAEMRSWISNLKENHDGLAATETQTEMDTHRFSDNMSTKVQIVLDVEEGQWANTSNQCIVYELVLLQIFMY